MAFVFLFDKCENEFGRRFIHIGLGHVVVAAARVVGRHSRCSNKRVKNVDVYKTIAIIICCTAAEARSADLHQLGLGNK